MKTPDPSIEPAFECHTLISLREDKNAETQFPENQGIDRECQVHGCEAIPQPWMRRRFRWLTQNVGVNQIFHRVSVDSESIGTKKILVWTGEPPVDGALVPRSNAPSQAIVATIKALDVELLPRLNPVYLPELCRQNNLALGRDGSLHIK